MFDCTTCGGDRTVTCPECGGTTETIQECFSCGGRGEKEPRFSPPQSIRGDEPLYSSPRECYFCGGDGERVGTCMTCYAAGNIPCERCDGTGDRRLLVVVRRPVRGLLGRVRTVVSAAWGVPGPH